VKTVILAGGSGGLGSAVSRSITEQGFKPIIGYLKNAERASALASELECRAIAGDISEPAVRQDLVAAAKASGEL